jgi:hypothetical protein
MALGPDTSISGELTVRNDENQSQPPPLRHTWALMAAAILTHEPAGDRRHGAILSTIQ